MKLGFVSFLAHANNWHKLLDPVKTISVSVFKNV